MLAPAVINLMADVLVIDHGKADALQMLDGWRVKGKYGWGSATTERWPVPPVLGSGEELLANVNAIRTQVLWSA